MASRSAFRPFQHFRIARHSMLRTFRRHNQTVAAAKSQSTVARIWHSEVGPKTVHFWAPVMKWALVLTGVSDLARPAENLSATQNIALTATGGIWTRWCLIIKPKNYMLAAVNFFLFFVGSTQLVRVFNYRRSLNSMTLAEETQEMAHEVASSAETVVEDPKGAVNKAVGR